ncbi:hypothetical protein AGDE_01456 [Angomonas deanei]|uniref:Uncharacterized protein n=1 Tax=Angomonas deanei TaxID=59799 RepID=A0A7G2CLN8_9TRYP|nr:hypothetical protein AGDE_01456 [Angomonas deanei]CAD2220335.1 hypothetical protein, conserved [Angomonas deanei]|eukprot:EPY42467.1 hypothetical protein AGDE_01456 [Angomonas deanei]
MKKWQTFLPPRSLTAIRCGSSYTITGWVTQRLYGSDTAPVMGVLEESTVGDEALHTRQLYCKALVHFAGGSRLSRDWIAGSTALACPDQSLTVIALQYNSSVADVVNFRKHLLNSFLNEKTTTDEEESCPNRAEGTPFSIDQYDAKNPQHVREVENHVLRQLPTTRCFLYDAMTASLFHCHGDLEIINSAYRRISSLGGEYLGVEKDVFFPLWRIALAELIVRKDKVRALGQQGGSEM